MTADTLSPVFSVPTHRRAILLRLMDGDASVSELGAPFAMTVSPRSRSISGCSRAPA